MMVVKLFCFSLKLQLQALRGEVDPRRRYLSPYIYNIPVQEDNQWRIQTPFISNNRLDPAYFYDYDEDFNIDYTDNNVGYKTPMQKRTLKSK